jgi:molybdopterin-binding protein
VGEQNLRNVFAARVLGGDEATGLTRLRFGPSEAAHLLFGPPQDHLPPALHVAVRPEDIALSHDRLSGTSIRNQLDGTIERVTLHDKRALLLVNVGVELLVRVSVQTVREMQLERGKRVCCLIKAAAVRYLTD